MEAKMISNLVHRNQVYDMFPYEKHIEDVVSILRDHGYFGDDIISGYLHDSIEDGDLTYNKIKKVFGYNVAEIVLACTDPSDARNRKEKKERVMVKLIQYPKAIPTKLADRIANLEHSIRMQNTDKSEMYLNEHTTFKSKLYVPNEHTTLWERLEKSIYLLKDISY
jgi:GTP pyrophosphokinase